MALSLKRPAAAMALSMKRTAVVTGANGIFGRNIVKLLVKGGWDVVCCVRREAAAAEMVADGGRCVLADLSTQAGSDAVASFLGEAPVHCLVNNAALTPESRQETAEGHEMQWAVNVLAYHRLTRALVPHLRRAGSDGFRPRVVCVASSYAGGLDLDDVEFVRRRYDSNSAYQASKQANRMLARIWADKLATGGVDVVSCHPGVATSNVSLGLGFDLDRSEAAQEEGARTPAFLAMADKLVLGGYYRKCAPEPCGFCRDVAACIRLWDLCDAAK